MEFFDYFHRQIETPIAAISKIFKAVTTIESL